MTTPTHAEYARYRIARAQETLQEAAIMAEGGHWHGCVNRLDYACFYAVNALLAAHDLGSKKHSGVRALFNQHFVKPGQVPKPLGGLYMKLFEMRSEGDYVDLATINPDTVRPWIPQAEEYVAFVTKLAKNSINTPESG